MPILIGIDEAGYGPTLGPLVVAATVWQVPPAAVDADLWERLGACVERDRSGDARLVVNDSKAAYDRAVGVGSLERTVLAFAHAAGVATASLAELLGALGAPVADAGSLPWRRNLDRPLPIDRVHGRFEHVAARLATCMRTAGVHCRRLAARVVAEDAFNSRVAATRNKAAVLLEPVLDLLADATERARGHDVYACIDRLGGRSDYRALLMAAFPRRSLHVVEASDRTSRYRLAGQHDDWQVEFAVDADRRRLPVALASMLAKYLREASMERFNAYWRQWLPGLRPTAGYYTDAQRFLADIGPVISRTGLAPEQFVRAR